jgi:hypothetical protein
MYEIGGPTNYIPNEHDCDDMVQEYRDYLHTVHHVPYSYMKIISARHKILISIPEKHVWLEVYKLYDGAKSVEDGNWYICDVPANRYMWERTRSPLYWGFYRPTAKEILPGRAKIRDGSGYRDYGDRYINGRWVRASKYPDDLAPTFFIPSLESGMLPDES